MAPLQRKSNWILSLKTGKLLTNGGEIILIDTPFSLYYRKTDKGKSAWIKLIRQGRQGYSFAISSVTKYEIYSGATSSQLTFWDNVLQAIVVTVQFLRRMDLAKAGFIISAGLQ